MSSKFYSLSYFSLKLKGSFRTYDGCCNENEHFPEKFGRGAAKKGAKFKNLFECKRDAILIGSERRLRYR